MKSYTETTWSWSSTPWHGRPAHVFRNANTFLIFNFRFQISDWVLMRITVVILTVSMLLGGCRETMASATTTMAATAPASQPEVLGKYTHQGALRLYRAAKYKAAEAMCLAAIADIEKEKGEKSPDLASPLDDLSTVYMRMARFKEAGPLIDRAESVLDKEKPQDAILLGRLAVNKGWRTYSFGDVRGAEKIFAAGQELVQKNQKEESVELAELINNLGLMFDDSLNPGDPPNPKRAARARTLLFQAWQMRKKLTGEESAESGESLNNLGMHYLYHGDGDEAIEMALTTLKKSLEVSEKVYGAEHPETAMSHVNLATALSMSGDNEEAEEHIRKALPITEKYFGKDHPDRAYELGVLGQLEQDRGNYREAEENFQEAVRIYEVVYGANHPNVAHPLVDLRDLYGEMGDDAKMKAVQKRIEKLRGKEI